MKEPFRSLFSLSAMEQKGVILLIMVILILTLLNLVQLRKSPRIMHDVDSTFITELQGLEQQIKHSAVKEESTFAHLPVGEEKSESLFYFDPNQASAGDLRRLGIPDRIIRTLINYRLHGGKFSTKEDLLRIYGLDSTLFRQLAPWVAIQVTEDGQTQKTKTSKVTYRVPLDINLADSAMLEKLPGIGPVLSQRIVRYRSILGGFYKTEQLAEVYGLSDSLVSVILPLVYADTSRIIKLNMNAATEQELAHHPYIGRYIARGIVAYRVKVKMILTIHELKANGILSGKDFEKLKIYLDI